ncbi:MAG TPA: AMP-binding protein [Steroidobacteraceae bacterium]|nr:AMP-binding protein [Steroidobacteraceae bacterium]
MPKLLPLIAAFDAAAPLLWHPAGALSAGEFLRGVLALAEVLPARPYLVNLCEQRANFLTAWCAAAVRGQANLLPASRAPQVIADAQACYGPNHRVDDEVVSRVLAGARDGAPAAMPQIPADHVIQIAFTSGSTGVPTAHAKQWGSLHFNTGFNAERIRECLPAASGTTRPAIIATVPPQHMYGTETSVLLPLLAGMTVHTSRPLFPADVATALAQVPAPRVLVTTPVHLRTLLSSSQEFPQVAVVVSATAPMDAALAQRVAARLQAPLLEMFGSTETCVIATRLTAHQSSWRLYPEVTVEPGADHTWVRAPWLGQATRLQDVVQIPAPGRMVLRGRNVDMIEIAGKRASLSDLTRRLLDIPGVRDAVVFQPSDAEAAAQGVGRVQRVAAVVVAPTLSAPHILNALAQGVDAAFLPRPLLLVSQLPRNELGKTTRAQLLQLLQRHPD